MSLKEFLKTLATKEERESFAGRCSASFGYLQHVANGVRKASAQLAISIERETGGLVTCEETCPNADWEYIRSTQQPESKPAA